MMYWVLRAAFVLSRHVPAAWRYRLGMLASEAVYWVWPAKGRATRHTMAVVVGDAPDGPRAAAAARTSLRNYGRYVVDFLNLPNLPPREIVRRTRVEGWEHLDRVMAAGHGVIFVTGHFGLWDYAPPVLASRYPGRIHLVTEPFDSPRIDALIQGQRAELGSTIIPMTNVRRMVRALRAGDILALLVDRPAGDDGVVVEFFGRYTRVPGGAAALAAMTGAAILPGYLVHHPDGGYDGVILPPIETSRSGDRAADVRRMTQGIFTTLERIVRRSPAHWFMFRDMWATSVDAPGDESRESGESGEAREAREAQVPV